ncbi:DUF1048 domain-containing protein [Clostridium sp.]|uniref:DUF1048 domain-containing protein n=1 Tax=Clostridium sp. TaxID=1506 RepID=UPI002FC7DE11
MIDKFIKLVIGDLGEKREYREMMKKVDKLPEDYKYAFKKIQKYMYSVGAPGGDITIFNDLTMFMDLLDLFESSAADGRSVIDVIGSDVSKFSDEFMSAHIPNKESLKDKLNKEIIEKLNKEGE